ncbi:Gfo/Idh/MocA family protein [Lacticaseibacillus mingshuiensis]|uniref:Gfo/Idh/MocA family protein n=1 Tax=Lacticaseibacillus mingshuiensis TaxID=2799574 RepID=UPI00194F01B2|nr:Gfo/Idh/MocA family oxidoreductase [Lacticaseibacillus mingshuiensis]
MTTYNWGIIGTGRIADYFAEVFPTSQHLYGVAAHKDDGRAAAFAAKHKMAHAYPDYASLLADPAIDIVYVATTHNFHYDNIKAALNAGKHVLAEKAITLNEAQLDELVLLAAQRRLILMEAQTIYHMPLYHALDEFKAAHQLGRPKMIQVAFGTHVPNEPEDRLLNPQLAGGAMLDIGIYALSFARRFMTESPTLLATQMVPTATGVDDRSSLLLTTAHQEQAQIALALQTNLPNRGVVAYENGYLTITDYGRATTAIFTGLDGKNQQIEAGDNSLAFVYEIEDMANAVTTGSDPTLRWTCDTITIITAARRAWGVTYPDETDL